MASERIVITVKTYPQLSKKYGETVCTAGMRMDGSWVRLYPIPFRLLDYDKRYRKWEIIETNLKKVTSDFRPESHNPIDIDSVKVAGKLDTSDSWANRRKLVFCKSPVWDELNPLIQAARSNQISLATFKPSEVLDFSWEEDDREWREDKIQAMRTFDQQGELFSGDNWREGFNVIPKLPFKFRYKFRDYSGKESNPQILDWEVGALFWKCMQMEGCEKAALKKVKEKMLDYLTKQDLHFFMGTTKGQHLRATNPWLIIGVFYPPVVYGEQLDLFDS